MEITEEDMEYFFRKTGIVTAIGQNHPISTDRPQADEQAIGRIQTIAQHIEFPPLSSLKSLSGRVTQEPVPLEAARKENSGVMIPKSENLTTEFNMRQNDGPLSPEWHKNPTKEKSEILDTQISSDRVQVDPIERVTTPGRLSPENARLIDHLEEMGMASDYSKFLREELAEKGPIATTQQPSEVNYMIRLREIVAHMLVQLNQIADKDRTQIEEMKNRFKQYTQKGADIQRDQGWYGLGFAIAALTISTVGIVPGFFASQIDREFVSLIGKDFTPQVGKIFEYRLGAAKHEADGGASVASTEWNAKTNKGQADSNSKQEIIGLLEKALEGLKRAAQAG